MRCFRVGRCEQAEIFANLDCTLVMMRTVAYIKLFCRFDSEYAYRRSFIRASPKTGGFFAVDLELFPYIGHVIAMLPPKIRC
jgi:hypothetical protein